MSNVEIAEIKFNAWGKQEKPIKTCSQLRFVHLELHLDFPRLQLETPGLECESSNPRPRCGLQCINEAIMVFILTPSQNILHARVKCFVGINLLTQHIKCCCKGQPLTSCNAMGARHGVF